MAGMTTRYYSLTGGLNTSMGLGTINSSTRGTETPDCYNVESYKLSGLKSMEGNKQFANTLPSSITLGHEYRKESDKFMIVTTSDGSVWCYDKLSNTFEKVYTFPNATQRHSACNFNQGVVISNGVDDLVYYNRGRNTKLSGTISITSGSTAVTGTDTEFTKDVQVGDYIRFEGINGSYKVEEITDDTNLILSTSVDIPAAETTYYCWKYTSDSGVVYTYFTTTTDDNDTVAVYEYSGGKMNEIATAYIANGQLIYEVSTNQEVTVTEIDYYCSRYTGDAAILQGYYPGNSASGLFRITSPAYVYIAKGDNVGSDVRGTYNHRGSVAYDVFNSVTTTSGALIIPKFVTDAETTYQANRSMVVGTIADGYATQMKLNGRAGNYPITFNLEPYEEGNISHRYTTIQTVTTGGAYTRSQDDDVVITTATSDINMYLTSISELNARLINSDDPTVDYVIRGLALNSYQGRLFIGGNDGNLYYSELGLIHGWDIKYGAGAIPPFYNDNSDFTALGIYGNYLIIHKRDYTYYLDGRNEPTSWEIIPYADLSCDSQQSWVGANTGYYVFSRKAGGIYPLMSRTAFINNYLGKEISEKIRESFVNINSALYDQIYPVYHPSKKYLMFYMPMIQGNGGSNYCFIYDFISRAWWLRIVPQQVTSAFVFDGKVYITTKNGKVLQEFKTLTFDGDVINFSWRSPWFQYGDGTNYLSTREFRVKISEEYTNNFYVRNRRDGYEEYHERNVTNDKEAFEALEWSDDAGLITETVWDEYDWVETGYLIKRFPLPDQFFTSQQIEFYGSVKDEAMCILGFEVDRIEREENSW